MNKWRVTIEKSPVQRKVIKVTGPETAKLAEAAALTSMKWQADDCISVETEPYELDAPDPPTVIEVAAPKSKVPIPRTRPQITELPPKPRPSPAPPKPTEQRKTAARKKN